MPETSIRGPRVMAREDTISFGAGSCASSAVINIMPAAAFGLYAATVAAANRPIQIDVCLWICMVVHRSASERFSVTCQAQLGIVRAKQKEATFDARELTDLAIYDRTVDTPENSFSFRKRFRFVCGSSPRQP